MSVVASTLTFLACFVLGLLVGGMLVIGTSLVGFWKSLSPGDFQAWFASHADRIGRVMIPLGVGGILASAAALAACWRSPARPWLLTAALAAIAVMVTYPVFFSATNAAFVRGGLSDSEVRSLLGRWETWHWIRTGLGALSFVAALRALHR